MTSVKSTECAMKNATVRKMKVVNLLMAVAVIGLAFASASEAAVITSTTIDTMSGNPDWTPNTSLWYQSYIPSAGAGAMLALGGLDPNDSGDTELQRQATGGGVDEWFSYKTDNGLAFNSVQIVKVYYEGYGGDASLQYKDVNAVWTSIASTTQVYEGSPSTSWRVWLDTYDLSSIKPGEVKVTVSGATSWTPMVSSVKLDVLPIPEPATMTLLSLSGLLLLLRKRRTE